MGYKIFGIATSQQKDRDGETILLDGVDTSQFNFLKDEHTDHSLGKIGFITKAKKIYKSSDATSWSQKKCFNENQSRSDGAPFLYFEAELHDDNGHPNAQAAAGLIDAVHRQGIGNIRASIEGGVLKKGGSDNKTLAKTVAHSVVLTVQPVNKGCLVFPMSDLRKSSTPYPLNEIAQKRIEEIKKSNKHAMAKAMQDNLLSLDKAIEYLEYYEKSLYTVTCGHCGGSSVFSKIEEDAPNVCGRCMNYFTMIDFKKALDTRGDE